MEVILKLRLIDCFRLIHQFVYKEGIVFWASSTTGRIPKATNTTMFENSRSSLRPMELFLFSCSE